MPLYFDASHVPDPRPEYILWCDGMGTGTALANSLRHSANFIFKLHRAFSNAVTNVANAHIYPVMDGVYVTVPQRNHMQQIIRRAFSDLANEFVQHHEDVTRCFVVRGAVAYGASIHGSDVSDDAFVHGIGGQHEPDNREAFVNSPLARSRSQLLLHSAMAWAYHAESNAPPFGIYVHDSALSVPQIVDAQDRGFPARLWFWWQNDDEATAAAAALAPAVTAYFTECEIRSTEIAYPKESIRKHTSGLDEYFREFAEQDS